MAERRIVVCADQQSANVQRQVLLQQGYQARLPRQLALAQWDASSVGGTQDAAPNCWIVVGDR
jgi:hypothetical protein